ncbi:hypothetical protein GCM10020366_42200 [Saccharopolyspora gregorii]|uniref:VOC domain-containing protein n=1 Tax=Saccharopolyspora gregorii TaxID=33914 RepID=A0ABP6RSP7_9PSEU
MSRRTRSTARPPHLAGGRAVAARGHMAVRTAAAGHTVSDLRPRGTARFACVRDQDGTTAELIQPA